MVEKSKQLQEIVRTGIQHMLKLALETEIDQFIGNHNDRVGEDGLKQIVRNGYHRVRSVQCGIGSIEVSVPRSRDRSKNVKNKTLFQSRIIPRYLRRVDELDGLLPDFYLKGLMTGDFSGVFSLLLGGTGEDECGGEEILSTSWVKWLEDQWKREYYDRYYRDDHHDKHDEGWGDGEWYPWIFIGLGGDGGYDYFSGHVEGYGRNKAPAPIDGLPKTNEPTFIATGGWTYGINEYGSGIKPLFTVCKPVQVSSVPKKHCRRSIGKNFFKSSFKIAS
ncbi:MAG: hypothetical protein GY940_41015 [bacterium]|nr:hypothetical protein [bacterium]